MLELHVDNEKLVLFILGGLAVGDSSDDTRSGKTILTESLVIPVINIGSTFGGRKKEPNIEGLIRREQESEDIPYCERF